MKFGKLIPMEVNGTPWVFETNGNDLFMKMFRNKAVYMTTSVAYVGQGSDGS